MSNAVAIEKKIINTVIEDLLAAGYAVTVNDGEDDVLTKSTDAKKIYAALGSTDEDWLVVYKEGEKKSFVRLIHGNGPDVICDYGVSLEPVMARAMIVAGA
jgi:hypothetical protein